MCSLFNSDKLGKLDEINCEEPVLIMMSGGIGCATLLAYLKKRGFQSLKGVFFCYNSCISKEQECAEKLASYYNVDLEIVDILGVYRNMVIEYNRKFEKVDDFYIPYRNGVIISLASVIAYRKGTGDILWGISSTASSHYPDASFQFVYNQKKTVKSGTFGRVNLITPFLKMEKYSIFELAKKFDVPLESTWSCIRSAKIACGKCFGCFDRNQSMAWSGSQQI